MSTYDVSLELAAPGADNLDLRALTALAERVMAGEDVEPGTSLAILVTGDEEVREMNRQFLGIDEATDVLSFPDEADDFVQGISEEILLGDIAIALPTATRQAEEAGHSLDAEVGHLLVHGILHLCGYDHEEGGEEEARMRAREELYLGDLGHVHGH